VLLVAIFCPCFFSLENALTGAVGGQRLDEQHIVCEMVNHFALLPNAAEMILS